MNSWSFSTIKSESQTPLSEGVQAPQKYTNLLLCKLSFLYRMTYFKYKTWKLYTSMYMYQYLDLESININQSVCTWTSNKLCIVLIQWSQNHSTWSTLLSFSSYQVFVYVKYSHAKLYLNDNLTTLANTSFLHYSLKTFKICLEYLKTKGSIWLRWLETDWI
jgi:hypothetical protein